MKNEIDGDLNHIPDTKTFNKFLLIGPRYVDHIRTLPQDLLRFAMVKESDAKFIVESMHRIEKAVAEWQDNEMIGLLHLRLGPPQSPADAQADSRHGGSERTMKVQDLMQNLKKDREILQSERGVSPRLGLKDEIPFPSPGGQLDDGRDFDD